MKPNDKVIFKRNKFKIVIDLHPIKKIFTRENKVKNTKTRKYNLGFLKIIINHKGDDKY